jgi:tetratricopeptide (TPR) repeat protein
MIMKTQTLKVIAFAAALFSAGTAEAQLEPLHRANADPASQPSVALAAKAGDALVAGQAPYALKIAGKAIIADPRNPWGYYDKADALVALNRIDEAVSAFREAEYHFSPADRWGKSIAIYGRANALDQAGRCAEAASAYREYAAFVETEDPGSADMAIRYSQMC